MDRERRRRGVDRERRGEGIGQGEEKGEVSNHEYPTVNQRMMWLPYIADHNAR